MNFGTWNVQGIGQKMDTIISEVSKLNLDIVTLTETKKKENGSNTVGDYVHIYTGVSKEKRAARGVSLIVNKNLKNKIMNWEAIDENILQLNIRLFGHDDTVITVYVFLFLRFLRTL